MAHHRPTQGAAVGFLELGHREPMCLWPVGQGQGQGQEQGQGKGQGQDGDKALATRL